MMFKRKKLNTGEPCNLVCSCFEKDALLRIECDMAVPYDLWDVNTEQQIYRPLTKKERKEFVYCVLRYGRSSILYRLFKILIFSLTRCIYPQQGAPKAPL